MIEFGDIVVAVILIISCIGGVFMDHYTKI